MNALRLATVVIPMSFLLACGGGGSGGGAAVSPTTPPPEPLPSFLATQDLDTLRTRFSGTAPAITSGTQIVSELETVAAAADTVTMNNIVIPGLSGVTGTQIVPDCSAGTFCRASIPNIGRVRFSLADDTDIAGFNTETRAIMDVDEVRVIENRFAGRLSGGRRLAFQNYAGWLDGSVFGTRRIEITEGSDTTIYYSSHSFGKASGSNPTGTGMATWSGVVTGINRIDSSHFPFQGTVTVDIDDLANPNVDVSISTRELPGGSATSLAWDDISLTNGIFEDTDGHQYIKGVFYGDGHEEVGGVFRDSNLYGAFGATKQ